MNGVGSLPRSPSITRRSFLQRGAQGAGVVGLSLFGSSVLAPAARAAVGAECFGPLQPPDANGLMLPSGFASRVVAVSNQQVAGTSHPWHLNPDGGATFDTADHGWIYVSNSERSSGNGGVGALRFDSTGTVIDAYSILSGTSRNCAGGPTPWGSWLSCEEIGLGKVYECDPFTPGSQGVVRSALGVFNHEAASVDPISQQLHLTEDRSNGLFYRFSPDNYPSLAAGTLEAAEILDPGGDGPITPGEVRALHWHVVPDPTLSLGSTHTRNQVPAATIFQGGEGCWFEAGFVYFSTKLDNRIWKLDTASNTIEIIYDASMSGMPILTNVDNVYASSLGDVYVAEDPGDLMIVAITPLGSVVPVLQLTGVSSSEITGPALSPDGTRLYFSSQRNPGTTYEVTGPFAPPVPAVPSISGLGPALVAAALAAAGALTLGGKRRGAPGPPPNSL